MIVAAALLPVRSTGGSGNRESVLGQVGALGQEVSELSPRAPARLPGRHHRSERTVGGGGAVARGDAGRHEMEDPADLTAAKKQMESREGKRTRNTSHAEAAARDAVSVPLRPDYTHKKPTPCSKFFTRELTVPAIFMDGRKHPAELDQTVRPLDRLVEQDTLVIDSSASTTSSVDHNGTRHRALHTIDAGPARPRALENRDDRRPRRLLAPVT